MAIGTERLGGERGGAAGAVRAEEGMGLLAAASRKTKRVGVGGTVPTVLRVDWPELVMAEGRRGMAIGKRSATGGALWIPGASGSNGPVPRGLIKISAGFFLRPPDCAARRVVKLMGGGGRDGAMGL